MDVQFLTRIAWCQKFYKDSLYLDLPLIEYSMEIEDEIFLEDDQDILDIFIFGFPRRRYQRSEYFENMDNYSFFRRFRLTKPSVMQLLQEIEEELEFDNDLNDSITPMNQLLATLRLYSCSGYQTSVGDFIGAHQSTISRIIKRVTNAIARLRPHYVNMPRDRERLKIATGFHQLARFPKVLGCVDGTHIKILSPGGEDAEVFRNRKGFFSINAQVIGDHQLKIRDVVARWPGSAHDLTIFNNSRIRARIENHDFPDCVLLGDNGYALKNYLLTPLLHPTSQAERLYNQSHIRTRNSVERLIGVWKRRFPVLAYGLRYKVEPSCNIIAATAVIHNIAISNNEDLPPLPENITDEELNYLIELGNIENNVADIENVENMPFNYRRSLINNYFAQI